MPAVTAKSAKYIINKTLFKFLGEGQQYTSSHPT